MGFVIKILKVLRQKYLPFLGKFVNLDFTYKTKKHPEPKYINAYGYIMEVENKYLLFKDNDKFEYIIDMNKIFDCTLAGTRRTVEEWQTEVQNRAKEKLKNKRL